MKFFNLISLVGASTFHNSNVVQMMPSYWPLDPNTQWVVLFYSLSCSACDTMIPKFIRHAAGHVEGMKFGAVNCSIESTLCSQERIQVVPTVKVFENSTVRVLGDFSNTRHEQRLGHDSAPGAVELTSSQFPLDPATPWVVMFYMPNCSPCKVKKPQFMSAALTTSRSKFGLFNCNNDAQFCSQMKIKGVPMIMMFYQGNEIVYTRDIDRIPEFVGRLTIIPMKSKSATSSSSTKANTSIAAHASMAPAKCGVNGCDTKATVKSNTSIVPSKATNKREVDGCATSSCYKASTTRTPSGENAAKVAKTTKAPLPYRDDFKIMAIRLASTSRSFTWESLNGPKWIDAIASKKRPDWWKVFKSTVILASTIAEGMNDTEAAKFGASIGLARIVEDRADEIRGNLLLDGSGIEVLPYKISSSELKYIQLTEAPMWALARLVPSIKRMSRLNKIVEDHKTIREVIAAAN